MVRDISYRHEMIRKVLHVIVVTAGMSAGVVVHREFGFSALRSLLFVGVLFSFFADYLRLEWKLRLPELRFLERGRELHTLHATTFTFLGTLLAVEFFSLDVALAGVAMFAFGDSAAAIVGRSLGGPKLYRNKSWSGSAAMFLVSLAAGWIILSSGWLALVMAFAATVIELAVEKLDDSFAIIVGAGFVGEVVSLL